MYNELYRKGKESKYTAKNVCICPGGRAALSRLAASMGNVNVGFFLPGIHLFLLIDDLFIFILFFLLFIIIYLLFIYLFIYLFFILFYLLILILSQINKYQ